MIIYSNSIKKFYEDINVGISGILNNLLKDKTHKFSGKSEIESWNSSLGYFSSILKKSDISLDCTISLEYNLPMTSKRIDLILSGYNHKHQEILIVFELKQWSQINDVKNSDFMVETVINGGLHQVVHPGYQVWSYTELFKDYNEYIQQNNVVVIPAVLLHNYKIKDNDILLSSKYDDFNKYVRIFGSNSENELINFINDNLLYGDSGVIMENIDSSPLRPSKKLQEEVNSLICNNNYFRLIDEQVVAFDTIVSTQKSGKKNVIIVTGNPGTGKSVIAINLLNYFLISNKICQYVSRNTAPRVIYSYKLKGSMKKNSIDNLFKSSGNYTNTEENVFDVLIVDEAHCLKEKSGLFSNYGENQIKEIIRSAKTSIFFIDEKQKVHYNDIGTIDNIEHFAKEYKAKVTKLNLSYQFRCNGSNEYLDFIDYLLGFKDKYDYSHINYHIKVVDTPGELLKIIKEKNEDSLSRIVAGYCWNWNKKELNNSNYHDIKIGDFGMSWNLGQNQTFVIDDSINEAGCIHSVQGLEFDYVGVIVGMDLQYIGNNVVADFSNHGSADPSFKGIKKLYKEDFDKANAIATNLIKNAYRVLLTRGIKGCYIYCEDDKLREYFKHEIKKVTD